MLTLRVSEKEMYNQVEQVFYRIPSMMLKLEHSLVSISKWEAIVKKSFLSSKGLTPDELSLYIEMMTLTQNVDTNVFKFLSLEETEIIKQYIHDSHSATYFSDKNNRPSREIITSELIYYWMIAFNIPFEAQKWHLNRLLALIKICIIKNSKQKKLPKRDIYRKNQELNAARRQHLNSKG